MIAASVGGTSTAILLPRLCLVKVKGRIDGVRFQSSFMALGDGRHMLPVKDEIRKKIDKQAGDSVRVQLLERLR